jgi:hypothetical protein
VSHTEIHKKTATALSRDGFIEIRSLAFAAVLVLIPVGLFVRVGDAAEH